MALEKQDLAILSLPFGIFQRDKPLSRSLDEENANRDAIVRSCQEAQQTFSIKAEVKTFEKEQYPRPGYLSVVLSGSGNQLLTAKRWLIQRHPKQVVNLLLISQHELTPLCYLGIFFCKSPSI